MDNYSPDPLFTIYDLETLRVLADPLRSQIYELLVQAPASVRQIAERLGVVPSRLYYHFNLLEKHELIRVVETRMVANIVEKTYGAAAYEVHIDPELLHFSPGLTPEAWTEIITSNIDTTREDLLRSINARLIDQAEGESSPMPRKLMMVSRATARIPQEYAGEFRARLNALVEEFLQQEVPHRQPAAEDQNFALLVAFYPSFYFGQENGERPGG